MRRILLIAALLCAVLAAPARAAQPRLTEVAGSQFPERTYALTLPRAAALTAAQVKITENGRPVHGVALARAAGSDSRSFGVVLAIDTSGSMHGAPLAGAVRSARAFVQHRDSSQPVAVITFGAGVRVVSGFTTDPAAIDRALSAVAPTGGRGSRILDGAAQAIDLIRAAKMTSASAIVLSDGGDVGSRTPMDKVGAAATAVNARVYTIGLHSAGTHFGTLNVLAGVTHGEFSAATSLDDLARVFERLGSRLANQYVVRYRSAVAPRRLVRVSAQVNGFPGTAQAAYRSPAPVVHERPPFQPSPADHFWTASGATFLMVILIAGLLASAVWVLIRPRGGSLRQRVAPYVGGSEQSEDIAQRSALLRGRLREGAGRSLEKARWWPTFIEKLEIGRVRIAPQKLLAWTAVTTLAVLAILTLATGSALVALLALVVPLIARSIVERRVAKQRKLFTEQLPDNLQVMASAMRAGHSFSGALSVVVAEAAEPTRSEMAKVVADERLGIPVDAALGAVVRRMESKDLEQVALVATLQRETGGNTAEVLESVTETVRERLTLRRTVQTLTAQGRMSRWVLTAIPIALLGLLTVINPTYMAPLYSTPLGKAALVAAAVMVTTGSLVIKKIVNIKV